MPITLGCPSCSKRFRARDESAGKRVKCPYCTAPVSVPSAEEAANAAAPTTALPPPSSHSHSPSPASAKPSPAGKSHPQPAPAARPSAPPPAPVASPDDWGAIPTSPASPVYEAAALNPLAEPPPTPEPAPAPLNFPKPSARPAKTTGKNAGKGEHAAGSAATKTPEQLAAPGWRKTRSGLFWVLFGLFWLALPGFVGFAKVVCEKSGVELPHGKGFISIPGVLNEDSGETFQMSAEDELNVLAYGVPILLGGLALGFGRLTCGAAPRSSGAKGMFALSGLFTFVALAGLGTAIVARKVLNYDAERSVQEICEYSAVGALIAFLASEMWFLTSLAASGATLKRPKAPRAVGFVIFIAVLGALVATIGLKIYAENYRPRPVTVDVHMYEQGALMLGWLLLIGVYWRAVGTVRGAITEFQENLPE